MFHLYLKYRHQSKSFTMKKLLLLTSFLFTLTFYAQNNPNFFLAPNEVTCLCPDANTGDSGTLTINGETKTFTKRSQEDLVGLINTDQQDPQIALTCTSGITDMSLLFKDKVDFNQNISSWDVSNVTSLKEIFFRARAFDQPLNNWDVSQVTDMSNMFLFSPFNQPLNNWDVSNVTNMKDMFYYAQAFNQPLNSWDVSSVTSMSGVFQYAPSFNQPLNSWDISNVSTMASMFSNATSFNQPLDSWDVSNVSNMSNMFNTAQAFNQDLSGWCVEQIPNEPSSFALDSALQNDFLPNWGEECVINNPDFTVVPNGVTCLCPDANTGDSGALTINGDTKTFTKRSQVELVELINTDQQNPQIALTCTSGITDMSSLFEYKDDFNQNISSWDVSLVTDMSNMFYGVTSFNQPLNNWDVSLVTDTNRMFFNAHSFNQPLDNWDVSLVTNVDYMLANTLAFNQDLSGWCVEQILSEPSYFAYKSTLQDDFLPNLGVNCNVSTINPDAIGFDILIYPNPSNSKVFIENDGQVILSKIKLIDMLGRDIKTFSTSQITNDLDVSGVDAGNYFVQFTTGDGQHFVKRLIVN